MYTARPLIVIEHLEPVLSNWLALEYENAARIAAGRLVFTNCDRRLAALASKLNTPCYSESITSLKGVVYSDCRKLVILDPQAAKPLEPIEAMNADAIVVGGILGDHPPQGRTRKLLSSRIPCALQRNIGPHQFPIDGAVYVAAQVARGKRLEEIDVLVGLRLRFRDAYGLEYEVELPYAYPIVDGRPLYHPKLPELLRSGLAYEEYRVSLGG